jgi:hypothetical protein
MKKNDLASNDLIDPSTLLPPEPRLVFAQGPEGAGYITMDQDGTILLAPGPWRHYLGMSLLELIKGGTFTLVRVLNDPGTHRS